jgi:hypothetical protein
VTGREGGCQRRRDRPWMGVAVAALLALAVTPAAAGGGAGDGGAAGGRQPALQPTRGRDPAELRGGALPPPPIRSHPSPFPSLCPSPHQHAFEPMSHPSPRLHPSPLSNPHPGPSQRHDSGGGGGPAAAAAGAAGAGPRKAGAAAVGLVAVLTRMQLGRDADAYPIWLARGCF